MHTHTQTHTDHFLLCSAFTLLSPPACWRPVQLIVLQNKWQVFRFTGWVLCKRGVQVLGRPLKMSLLRPQWMLQSNQDVTAWALTASSCWHWQPGAVCCSWDKANVCVWFLAHLPRAFLHLHCMWIGQKEKLSDDESYRPHVASAELVYLTTNVDFVPWQTCEWLRCGCDTSPHTQLLLKPFLSHSILCFDVFFLAASKFFSCLMVIKVDPDFSIFLVLA